MTPDDAAQIAEIEQRNRPRRIYVTFSGARYHATTQRIVEDAPKFGADAVWCYDDFWLRNCRPDFCDRTEWLWKRKAPGEAAARGLNWFAWKSYVVLDAYRRLAPGEVLLYSDADTAPIADLSPLYEQCIADKGVMLFNARGCVQKVWTKRDAALLMGADELKYLDRWQAVARFMLFQKGGEFPAERFLLDWLAASTNPLITTFDRSILAPEYPEMIQPRCEQAALGILATRYNLPLYREACEFGCHSEPPMLNQEREWPGCQQVFTQCGAHSYRPGYGGDESEGSAFRTVND